MRMKLIVLVLVMFLGGACTSKIGGGIQTFEVDPQSMSDKSFDGLYRLKEVIPLETTDSSIMSLILKVVATPDRIFVLTWQGDGIYSFDRKGKFMGKLQKQGKGPGEYLNIKDFVVTEEPRQLIAYDLLGKLIHYDWNGNFLREENWDGYISQLEHLPDGNFLINHAMWPTTQMNDTAHIFRVATPDGKYLRGEFPFSGVASPLPVMPSVFYKGEHGCYVAPITGNTIYEYDFQSGVLSPAFQFSFKGAPVPSHLESKDAQQPFFYAYYVLSCEYIGKETVWAYACNLKESKFQTLVGSRKSGEVHVFPHLFEDQENELTLERYFQQTGFGDDLLIVTYPLQVLNRTYKKENSIGYRLSEKVSEEDNPILLIYEERVD